MCVSHCATGLAAGRGVLADVVALVVAALGRRNLELQVDAGAQQLVARRPEQYLWSYNRYKTPAGIEPPTQQGAGLA